MNRNNQDGFADMVLAIVAAAIIIGIAVVVYTGHTKQAAFLSTPTPSPTVSASPASTGGQASTPATTASARALATVKALYTAYNKTPNEATRRAYLTPNFNAEVSAMQVASDPILCAQNNPDAITYDQPVAAGKDFMVRVHTAYGTTDNPIDVKVDGTSLLVNAITCKLQ